LDANGNGSKNRSEAYRRGKRGCSGVWAKKSTYAPAGHGERMNGGGKGARSWEADV